MRHLEISDETFEAARKVRAALERMAALEQELREARAAYQVLADEYRPLYLVARRLFNKALGEEPQPEAALNREDDTEDDDGRPPDVPMPEAS